MSIMKRDFRSASHADITLTFSDQERMANGDAIDMRNASGGSGMDRGGKLRQSTLRRKKLSHSHPYGSKEDDILLEPLMTSQAINIGDYDTSPIGNLRKLLGTSKSNSLFCELMKLCVDYEGMSVVPQLQNEPDIYSGMIWAEKARWIKYEETVEDGGLRFSKPHITLLALRPLLQLRSCFLRGSVLLDVEASTYVELVDAIVCQWLDRNDISPETMDTLERVMLAGKRHLVKNQMRDFRHKYKLVANTNTFIASINTTVNPTEHEEQNSIHDHEPDSTHNLKDLKATNQNLQKKLPADAESAVIFVGAIPHLSVSVSSFIRLKTAAQLFPEIPEIAIPLKFLFVLLVPKDHYENESLEIGKCLGSLMIDEIFGSVAYHAHNSHDLSDGIDEVLSQTVVVPPGKWNPKQRWEPKENMEKMTRKLGFDLDLTLPTEKKERKFKKSVWSIQSVRRHELTKEEDEDDGIRRTGVIFGGLVQDFKRKIKWYPSDFIDFFRGRISQSLAVIFVVFFANITKIITFGGVMGHLVKKNMGVEENLLAGGICNLIFALFSGQPLTILSATGPSMVFETILYRFCNEMGWEYLPARFWVGIWTALIILVLVATDASFLIGLITRFTEETFAALISIIFIIEATEELLELQHSAPITYHPKKVLASECLCDFDHPKTHGNGSLSGIFRNFSGEQCSQLGGIATGLQCYFKPDVYLFSVIIFFCTFVLAVTFKYFRHSRFFPSEIRNVVADFGVFISVLLMTGLSQWMKLDVERLDVPTKFKPTGDRSWIVDPFGVHEWWIAFAAVLPAMFYSILIVMEQQITSVIINRKDNKLRKGYGYHLDLLVVSILMVICATFGMPYYCAATVISLMHGCSRFKPVCQTGLNRSKKAVPDRTGKKFQNLNRTGPAKNIFPNRFKPV